MRFSALAVLLSLTTASLSAPIDRRAAAGVLTIETYDEFSVSSGVSGNALAEVNAKFPVCSSHSSPTTSHPLTAQIQVDQSNLAGVAASDLAIISSAAKISEAAETGTGGFDDAITAAGGKGTTAGKALQNGKIKKYVSLAYQVATFFDGSPELRSSLRRQ